MGWFGRGKGDGNAPSLVELAHRTLAELGVETRIDGDADDLGSVRLVAASGQVYLLGNLAEQVRDERPRRRDAIVAAHFDRMLRAEREPDAEDLGADALRDRIRLRLMVESVAGEMPDLSYARPFAPGLVLGLCVDNPTTVVTLSASTIPKLALGVDELFAIGQLRTGDEPIDAHTEMAPGMHVVEGDSLFTASKAANMPDLFGPVPHGIVFAVPNRHLLLAVPIVGPESIAAIRTMAGAFVHMLEHVTHPGGVLSPHLLFSHSGEVSVVSDFDGDGGALRLLMDERLRAALEEAGDV